jgi:translocator protein
MEGLVLSATVGPRARSLLGLAGFLVACFAAAALGSVATTAAIPEWYATLDKPAFTPPSWVFGPAWTTLYILMAVAAWRVWTRDGFAGATTALTLFFIQLALNAAWSMIFFGLRAPGWALAEIIVLWVAIVATTIHFFRHSSVAGWLMVPYILWVSFATVLNAAIWRLN